MKVDTDTVLNRVEFDNGEVWRLKSSYNYTTLIRLLLSESQFNSWVEHDYKGKVSQRRYNLAKLFYEKCEKKSLNQ